MKGKFWSRGAAIAIAVISVSLLSQALKAETGSANSSTAPTSVPALAADSAASRAPAVAIHPAKLKLPPDLAQLVQLAQSGLSDAVLIAFIQKTPFSTAITAEQVVYLRDIGISPAVITAVIEHGKLAQTAAETTPPSSTVPREQDNYGAPPPPDQAEMTDMSNNPEPAPGELPENGEGDYGGYGGYGGYYGALAPYGCWMNFPGYGWCWQPMVCTLNSQWQPYCDNGCWQSSDHGWFWNSQYSWGGTAFHYGRWWHHSSYGWLWQPGQTWSPAWVTWRQTSTQCGWAPMPPDMGLAIGLGFAGQHPNPWIIPATFGVTPRTPGFGLTSSSFTWVPLGFLINERLSEHRLAFDASQQAFGSSWVADQFTIPQDGGFINRGVDPQQVEAVTHTAIRQAPVRELQVAQASAIARVSSSSGGSLGVPRARVAAFSTGLAPMRPVSATGGSGRTIFAQRNRNTGSTRLGTTTSSGSAQPAARAGSRAAPGAAVPAASRGGSAPAASPRPR